MEGGRGRGSTSKGDAKPFPFLTKGYIPPSLEPEREAEGRALQCFRVAFGDHSAIYFFRGPDNGATFVPSGVPLVLTLEKGGSHVMAL